VTHENNLYNSVAPLANVSAFVGLVERVKNRAFGLPGLGVFYGFSGYGKSTAATYAANHYRAYCVQVKSVWTPKKLCQAILIDLGIKPMNTIGDMVEQVSGHLAKFDRPLIIDEADHLVRKNMIEVVRDIYESSGAPVILVGEELLPQNLQRWERVHGRVLDWVAAQPGTAADVGHLAPIYCPGVTIDDAMKDMILRASGGSIRRICVNLERVKEQARTRGTSFVTGADWGKRDLFTGTAPSPRRAVA
jgi:DNA transposition AAA+ family ATPase